MPRPQRNFILAISIAALIVGLTAGVKIAQIQNDREIRVTLNPPDARQLPENKPPQISKNFYKPTATTTIEKPAKKPSAPEAPAIPSDGITADAYIVGNLDTGEVYLERNADAVLPFASMSKLITALVATNIYSLDAKITVASTSVSADLSGIRSGETFTVRELLEIMLLSSSNRAAETFALSASSTPYAEFIKLMDGYSWEIGMPHAFFADSSGLDRLNSGTARGFLAMAQYLYKSRNDILAITRIPSASFATTTEHDAHIAPNIHPFVSDPRFLGGKTGHTYAALDTMLTILKIGGHPVAFIVLRSEDRAEDTSRLIEKLD